MILNLILLQAEGANLLLGFMPESIGLLMFGVILIGSTVLMRRLFREREDAGENIEDSKNAILKFKSENKDEKRIENQDAVVSYQKN